MKNYQDFLKQKAIIDPPTGFDPAGDINPKLFDFQKDIVKWALRRGRAAVFADCGLGKSPMQLEWADHIAKTQGPVLILAPLAVAQQTVREGKKFGIDVYYEKEMPKVVRGITITNYERLDKFDPVPFVGIVLDESSIVKSYSGTLKKQIMRFGEGKRFKLACTATPSPNDHMEILNHAEFLDVMKSHEALSIWFINDTMNMGKYKLKNHAREDFWKWVSNWAVSISSPADLGYEDGKFRLPKLNVETNVVQVDQSKGTSDMLFRIPSMSATDYHEEKRLTVTDRAMKVAEIVKASDEIFCIWCETNYEADELTRLIPEAVEVRGDDKPEDKEKAAMDFTAGKIRILISKPSIFGFGLNFQICHNVIFCGLSYSYESYYQATRRFWRFGQTKPVNVRIVIAETELNVINTIKEKEVRYQELKRGMNTAIKEFQSIGKKEVKFKMDYERKIEKTGQYEIILGDCVQEIKTIPDGSVDFQIFSPPFSNLYIYSDSFRDMGNCKTDDEFFDHFGFLIPELYRILTPGRICAVHCKQLVNYKGRDGMAGLRDFRGEIIRAFTAAGFAYHSEVTIWKDPVIEMQRTKAHGLLYKQLRKDSTYSRQGLPDYLVIFRKWPDAEEDPKPVNWKTKDNFELDKWQKYASPVWFDIQQTNVLNIRQAREDKDEKHICPLQLDVIERAVEMWTNPGDVVFSPFTGIGSEGYMAVKMGRKFKGIELKESYFNVACENLKSAIREHQENKMELFAVNGE